MRTIQFGVRIPPDRFNDPTISIVKRIFRQRTLSAILALSTVTEIVSLMTQNGVFLFVLVILGFLVYWFIYYLARKHLMTVKRNENWTSGYRQHTAVEASRGPSFHASLIPYIGSPLLIIAATVVIGVFMYPLLPVMIPLRVAGPVVGQFVAKSFDSAFRTVFYQIIVCAIIMGISSVLIRIRSPLEYPNLEVSLFRQQAFGRGIFKSLMILLTFIEFTLMVNSLTLWNLVPSFVDQFSAIPLFIVIILIARYVVKMGQMGSLNKSSSPDVQIKRKSPAQKIMNRDDDHLWKGGSVYFNRSDPSILVPRRFGIGYTFNMANRAIYLGLPSLIASLAFIILTGRIFLG